MPLIHSGQRRPLGLPLALVVQLWNMMHSSWAGSHDHQLHLWGSSLTRASSSPAVVAALVGIIAELEVDRELLALAVNVAFQVCFLKLNIPCEGNAGGNIKLPTDPSSLGSGSLGCGSLSPASAGVAKSSITVAARRREIAFIVSDVVD